MPSAWSGQLNTPERSLSVQVQPQPPARSSGSGRRSSRTRPTGQLRAFGCVPGATALDPGGVDDPHVVGPQRGVGGQCPDDAQDQAGRSPAAACCNRAAGAGRGTGVAGGWASPRRHRGRRDPSGPGAGPRAATEVGTATDRRRVAGRHRRDDPDRAFSRRSGDVGRPDPRLRPFEAERDQRQLAAFHMDGSACRRWLTRDRPAAEGRLLAVGTLGTSPPGASPPSLNDSRGLEASPGFFVRRRCWYTFDARSHCR